MQIKVQLVFKDDADGPALVQEVARLERDNLAPGTLGLTLAEAKPLLQTLQSHLVQQQVSHYQQQHQRCPHCQQQRRIKEHRPLVYRSLFGKLHLPSTRFFHCDCQSHQTKSFSPLAELLTERTAPELLYLESKLAALMSYGQSAELLAELLPVDEQLNVATIRNHTQQLAERLEAELGDEQLMFVEGCPRDWAALPRPDMPLTVGIDGGYVRAIGAQAEQPHHCFEVITGKSIADDGTSKCFGLVNAYDPKPRRRLFEVLKSQGMQMNQQVTFLSDGGDTVRDLQLYLNPQAEHLLDWFHITMRITVMKQMAKGVTYPEDALVEDLSATLESIKWYLWHGNVFRALQEIELLTSALHLEEMSP
ncbi:MAG TPA: ISKra4 family transposase, partial [Leptolyngbyaceae cyanobacterium]